MTRPALTAPPRPGSIGVARVSGLPRPGSIASPAVITRRGPGSIDVERVATSLPPPQSLSVEPTGGGAGQTDLGRLSIDDRVVAKVASRAAAENSDAGAVATRLLGAAVPGLDRLGGRSTSLESLPKATATVDGSTAFIAVQVSVRYPAPLVETTEAVRSAVRDRVGQMTGLSVAEVDISVDALVTDLPTPPRVR